MKLISVDGIPKPLKAVHTRHIPENLDAGSAPIDFTAKPEIRNGFNMAAVRRIREIEDWTYGGGWPVVMSDHLREVISESLRTLLVKWALPRDPGFTPKYYAPTVEQFKKWLWSRKLEKEANWDEEAILEMANVLET